MIFFNRFGSHGGGFSQPETPQELERERNRMATNASDKATRAAHISKMQLHAADLHQGGKGDIRARSYLHIDPATSQHDLDKIYGHLSDMTPEPMRAKYGLASRVPAPLNNTVGAAMDKAAAPKFGGTATSLAEASKMAGVPLNTADVLAQNRANPGFSATKPAAPAISGETRAAVPVSNPALDATTAARATLGPGASEDAVARKAALDAQLAGQGARADANLAGNVAQLRSNQAQGATGTFSNASHGTVTQGAPQPDIHGMAGNVYDPRTDISHTRGLANWKYVDPGDKTHMSGTNVMTAGDTGRPSNIPMQPTVQGSTNNRTVGLPGSQGKQAQVAQVSAPPTGTTSGAFGQSSNAPAVASSNPAVNVAAAVPPRQNPALAALTTPPATMGDISFGNPAGTPGNFTLGKAPTPAVVGGVVAMNPEGLKPQISIGNNPQPTGLASTNPQPIITGSQPEKVNDPTQVASLPAAQSAAPQSPPVATAGTPSIPFGQWATPSKAAPNDEDEKRRQAALAARQPVTSL